MPWLCSVCKRLYSLGGCPDHPGVDFVLVSSHATEAKPPRPLSDVASDLEVLASGAKRHGWDDQASAYRHAAREIRMWISQAQEALHEELPEDVWPDDRWTIAPMKESECSSSQPVPESASVSV